MPKISELTINASPAGTDVIPLVGGGITYKGTLASLPISDLTATALATKALLAGSGTQDFAAKILTATTVTATGTVSGATVNGTSGTITTLNSTTGNITTVNATTTNTSNINGGQIAGFRNLIINGNFKINQRESSSASTAYGAGVYTVDRWKGGASGVTMSFAASGADNTVTITAGTLVQAVEDVNVGGGVYTLSWSGTATARIAINGAATSGAYAASPITTSSATGGQQITVEFSTGTVGLVQLETGSKATTFERRLYSTELVLCQRYYWRWVPTGTSIIATGAIFNTTTIYCRVPFPVEMRTAPTCAVVDVTKWNILAAGATITSNASAVNSSSKWDVEITFSNTSAPFTAGHAGWVRAFDSSARFYASAEL